MSRTSSILVSLLEGTQCQWAVCSILCAFQLKKRKPNCLTQLFCIFGFQYLHIFYPYFRIWYLVFCLKKGERHCLTQLVRLFGIPSPFLIGLGYWFGHLNWPNKLITANIVPSIVLWYFAVSQCETLEAFQNSLESIEATASALEWIVEVHCPSNNQTLTIQMFDNSSHCAMAFNEVKFHCKNIHPRFSIIALNIWKGLRPRCLTISQKIKVK